MAVEDDKESVSENAIFDDKDKQEEPKDFEEGECSESDSEKEDENETDAGSESDVSVSTVSDADNDGKWCYEDDCVYIRSVCSAVLQIMKQTCRTVNNSVYCEVKIFPLILS